MALTQQQIEAINTDGRSILLNAGAGSGKTHVLTERVVRMLSSGMVQAQELLVLTFTKAAAQEMKNRIASKMAAQQEQAEEALRKDPANRVAATQVRLLNQQISMLPSASIQTIHSFCNDVVRENHALVGLPGNVNLISELEQAGMKDRIAKKIIASGLKERKSDTELTVRCLGGIRNTKKEIRKLSEKLSTFDDRRDWEKYALKAYESDNIDRNAMKSIKAVIETPLQTLVDSCSHFQSDPLQSQKTISQMSVLISAARKNLDLLNAADLQTLSSLDLSFIPSRMSPIKTEDAESSHLKKELQEAVKQLRKLNETDLLLAEQIRRMNAMKPVIEEILFLTGQFDKMYCSEKKKRGLIDFSDMERLALDILNLDLVADSYKSRYKQIFVDEYQDTNPVQEKIISKVATQDNLFCVGDMKQSIYRFRSADPLLFRNRTQAYKQDRTKGLVINLSKNFRSTTNILNCCDDIFSVLAEDSSELEYGLEDRLQVGREQQGRLQKTRIITLDPGLPSQEANLLESQSIAGFVQKRMKEPVYDPTLNGGKGGMRTCRYSDFAVIARKRTEYLSSLMNVFREYEIPYSLDKSGPLIKTMEIQMLMQILGLGAGYEDDCAVQNLIHNGFLNFTDEDLVALAGRKLSLMDSIRSKSDDSGNLSDKCRQAVRFFEQLQSQDDSRSLPDVVEWAVDQLDFRSWCAAMGDGKQRLANLDKLIQMADDFQRNGKNRLHAFISALRHIDPELDSLDSAKVPAASDSLLLTTIHGSKGMQFPIVIIPYTGKAVGTGSRMNDTRVSIEHESGQSETYRIGIDYTDPEAGVSGNILYNDQIRTVNREKSVEEERRLLYVAMTRAQEELVITGEMPAEERRRSSLLGWIFDALDRKKNKLGDWAFEKAEDYISSTEIREPVEYTPLQISSDQFEPEDEIPSARDDFPVPAGIGASKAVSLLSAANNTGQLEHPFLVSRNEEELEEDTAFAEAAARGTRLHTLMEKLDFKRLQEIGYLENLTQQVLKEYSNEIDPEKIRTLFNTPEGNLICTSEVQIREKPASISVPYSELDSRYHGKINTNLFAVIDLVVKKDGKWYLFDYKSDRIGENSGTLSYEKKLQERADHHKLQMELYRRVLSKAFDIDIEASWLVFTDAGVFRKVYDRSEN